MSQSARERESMSTGQLAGKQSGERTEKVVLEQTGASSARARSSEHRIIIEHANEIWPPRWNAAAAAVAGVVAVVAVVVVDVDVDVDDVAVYWLVRLTKLEDEFWQLHCLPE